MEKEGEVKETWGDFFYIYRPNGVKKIVIKNISEVPLSEVYELVKKGSDRGWECFISAKNNVLVCLKE